MLDRDRNDLGKLDGGVLERDEKKTRNVMCFACQSEQAHFAHAASGADITNPRNNYQQAAIGSDDSMPAYARSTYAVAAVSPPSTTISCAVMYWLSSLARNNAAWATSQASPMRFIGT